MASQQDQILPRLQESSGKVVGIKEGEKNKAFEIAKQMLADNFPIGTIVKYSGLTEEEIKNI